MGYRLQSPGICNWKYWKRYAKCLSKQNTFNPQFLTLAPVIVRTVGLFGSIEAIQSNSLAVEYTKYASPVNVTLIKSVFTLPHWIVTVKNTKDTN